MRCQDFVFCLWKRDREVGKKARILTHLNGAPLGWALDFLDKVKSSSLFASKASEEEKNADTDNCWIKFE